MTEIGPIDYLVIEFAGTTPTGEGLPMLVDLVDRRIIRILDLTFVRKNQDGSIVGRRLADFDRRQQLDLAVFEGASSGLLGPRTSHGWNGAPAGQFRRHADLREPLGRTLGGRAAPGWRRAGRLRTDSAAHPAVVAASDQRNS